MQTLDHWLFFDFREELIVSLVKVSMEGRVQLPDSYLTITETPGSTGHYDWLRNKNRTIIGLRYWPFEDVTHKKQVSDLISKVSHLSYVKVLENRYMEFFFKEIYKDQVCEKFSNDQDLSDNGIIDLQNGHYGMFFEVDITEEEIHSITSLCL